MLSIKLNGIEALDLSMLTIIPSLFYHVKVVLKTDS